MTISSAPCVADGELADLKAMLAEVRLAFATDRTQAPMRPPIRPSLAEDAKPWRAYAAKRLPDAAVWLLEGPAFGDGEGAGGDRRGSRAVRPGHRQGDRRRQTHGFEGQEALCGVPTQFPTLSGSAVMAVADRQDVAHAHSRTGAATRAAKSATETCRSELESMPDSRRLN